ncbi:hypothetical protein ACHAW6_007664 [Cyclotella cf. meneghiniana]
MKSSSYQVPSAVLQRLFLPPRDPSLLLSPSQRYLILLSEPPLPSIEAIARPEEKLAGLRFDPSLLVPSTVVDWATSLTIRELSSARECNVELPEDSEGIRYVRFHPTRELFVFCSKVKNEKRLELYKCVRNHDDGEWVVQRIPLENRRMNFITGCAYQFNCDELLISTVPIDHPDPPQQPITTGPAIQVVEKNARKAPGRTYQDLLKNEFDEEKLRYYLNVELISINVVDCAESSQPINIIPQSAGGAMLPSTSQKIIPQNPSPHILHSIQPSPSSRFLLVTLLTTFSYSVPISRFGKSIEIWDLHSKHVINVATLPVDDEIPLSYDACSRHPRNYRWHPLKDAILYVQALDGGDPAVDVGENGERDGVYTRSLIVDDNSGKLTLEEPVKVTGLRWRFADLDYMQSGMSIIEEYRWKDRMERKWVLDANGNTVKMLWERCWQDRYNAPGEPLMRRMGDNGQYFIVQPSPTSFYLKGAGASPLGDRPFLDVLDFGGEIIVTKRLWRCVAPTEGELDPLKEVDGVLPRERKDVYESIVCLMDDNDTMLISRESKVTPRNYNLTKLSDLSNEIQVTFFGHPQPDLLGVTKELVHYKREDGVDLTCNLYLPANYDGTPRPTLFWAYPREFKDAKSAGQVKGSKHTFVYARWASPIHWAAKGWVIMDDFALPVIGEGDKQPNDTFIEQIVMGAKAAVEYATSRGVCDPNRCAVGGHSYGSFMTAHLLSHTSLFAAGIGRSGAFNRTLTPMSFQSEDRSIWETPDTYITMSPLMHVKKYSEQDRVGKLLLIHGEADENSGTYPMQSERYFAALKAFGIESKLVLLPHERHGYRAKESILHMAYEQEEWLKSLEDEASV